MDYILLSMFTIKPWGIWIAKWPLHCSNFTSFKKWKRHFNRTGVSGRCDVKNTDPAGPYRLSVGQCPHSARKHSRPQYSTNWSPMWTQFWCKQDTQAQGTSRDLAPWAGDLCSYISALSCIFRHRSCQTNCVNATKNAIHQCWCIEAFSKRLFKFVRLIKF